jgi:hypothetical protein
MANNTKKYVSLTRLSNFLDNIKAKYSQIGHKHTTADLTDYKVDTELSSTSTNPVQNKVLDAEFDAISTAMSALDLAIDGKADASHNHDSAYAAKTHNHDGVYATATHNHDTKYDSKGAAEAVQTNLNTVSDKLDAHTTNADIHVTTTNKSNWNSAYTHSTSAHARVDATKVEDSTTNGNIKINGTETNVYSHPNSGVSAGTYKSVTVNAQGHVTGGSNPTTLSGYGITDAETKTDAASKLTEAKTYADNAAKAVKDDLLNNAGAAYDTLKELGDLIDDNKDAIDALEDIAAGKANSVHTHAISDVTNLQSALDGKANSSHGTHVTYSTTAPVMDGTAAVGTASTVARSDHKHPTDTSRASKTEFDSHTANTTAHITASERTNWNAAKTHADSAHAPSDAQKNQNAFSNIAVSGQTTVAADTATDTVTFVGSNVSITTDATNDKVTFSVADATDGNKGVVQLSSSYSSTYTDRAATPQAVKYAYDRADDAYELAETKQDEITGAATTIAKSNLLASRALVSNTNGKIAASSVTSTELEYLDGATSNIQAQLNDKAAYSHTHSAAHITSGIMDAGVLPKASETKAGIVSTGEQTFAGIKTFTDKIYSAGIQVNNGISAETANTYDIGSSLKPFKNIHTQNLYFDSKIVAGSVLYGGGLIRDTEGTASTKGVVRLELGNYVKEGRAGNAQGYIEVYNENNGSVLLSTEHTGASTYHLHFPSHGGTIATTSDLETLASISTLTTSEYNELEASNNVNANTLYMLTDAEEEEEVFITVADIDSICVDYT